MRLRLPREERRDAVCSLRESGLSTRAIAAAVGVDQKSVRNDLVAGEENSSPDEPVVDAEVVKPTPVTGTDGKTYRPKRKPKPKPPKPEQPITTEPPGGLTENSPGQTDRVRQALANAKAARATDAVPDDSEDEPDVVPHDSDTGPDLGIVLSRIAADLDKLAVYVTALDTDARLKVVKEHIDAINDVTKKLQRMLKALKAAQKTRAQGPG